MANFMETRWSLINRAAQGQRDALGEVYSSYWSPLLAYARYELGLDVDAAEEAVQDFTCQVFVDMRVLEQADRNKGKFRSYLKTSFRNFVYQHWRRNRAKNGKDGRPLSLDQVEQLDPSCADESPALVFEKAWVLELLAHTLTQWRRECRKRDWRRWQVFELRVLNPLLDDSPPPTYDEIFEPLGFDSPKAAMNALTNANRAIQRHLRARIEEELTRGADSDGGPSIESDSSLPDREGLERAIDSELLDIRRILSASGDAPPRIQARKPNREPFSPPAKLSPAGRLESSEGYESTMRAFFSAHLQYDDAEKPTTSVRCDIRRRLLPPDPAECDFRRLLAVFLNVAPAPTQEPTADECRKSLAAQLELPLSGSSHDASGADGSDRTTFADLLAQSRPSLDGLIHMKDYTRDCREAETSLPKEVATVLYFSAIALALTRLGERITSLPDEKIAAGVRWSLAQSWLDARVRQPLEEATGRLRLGEN